MSRNLVICCDGTNNQFGSENTNVVRLVQVLDRDPVRQHVYYDPGVGTLPEPGAWTKVQKKLSELFGLAFGAGIIWKVGEAYSFLMDYWEPGDDVFLIGFSRGAYAVRVLAGLLHSLGLMPHGNYNLVPYVLRLYDAVRKEGTHREDGKESDYWKLCDDFRWTFSRRVTENDDSRHFRVHFLGVWDTVSSVGWVWNPKKFPYTARNPSINIVRHAISLDERRCFFRQNQMERTDEQDLEEVWFPGVHCDVGGGYPEKDGGLWRTPFEWLLHEAQRFGLFVNRDRLEAIMKTPVPRPWMEPQHESLRGPWWLAEVFPKMTWRPDSSRRRPCLGLGRHRFVHDGALMYQSTLLRIRENARYSPPNLSKEFLDTVRGLLTVPETLPYKR
jgi:uncharacterized protein (DUF2235 family)